MQQAAESGPYRRRLRADSELWVELSYCNDHGIPHSEFLEWAQEDREKAIAFLLEKNSKCPMCGTAEWEWDPKQGGNKFAYEAVAKHCQGCYVKDASSDDTERRPGLTIELHPTGTRESAQRMVAAQRRAKSSVRKKQR